MSERCKLIPLRAPSLATTGYFEVRLNSVAAGLPIAYDIYIIVNAKPTLLRKRGDTLTADRLRALSARGAMTFLVPEDQRELYVNSIRLLIRDPEVQAEAKGRIIKEAAFLQIQDLFRNPNTHSVLHGTEALVGDMVTFLSGGPAAAGALLKLSSHSNYTFNHSVNVAVYSILLTKRLHGFDPRAFITVGMAALLHDIGKKDLPADLLNKTVRLTDEEDALMRQHPILGAKALEPVVSISTQVKEVVAQHHEHYDGTGYPARLSGDQISKITRIVSIADAFDALTTERARQKPFTPQEALDLMSTLQPSRFDPTIFKHFNSGADGRSPMLLTRSFDPCSPQPIEVLRR